METWLIFGRQVQTLYNLQNHLLRSHQGGMKPWFRRRVKGQSGVKKEDYRLHQIREKMKNSNKKRIIPLRYRDYKSWLFQINQYALIEFIFFNIRWMEFEKSVCDPWVKKKKAQIYYYHHGMQLNKHFILPVCPLCILGSLIQFQTSSILLLNVMEANPLSLSSRVVYQCFLAEMWPDSWNDPPAEQGRPWIMSVGNSNKLEKCKKAQGPSDWLQRKHAKIKKATIYSRHRMGALGHALNKWYFLLSGLSVICFIATFPLSISPVLLKYSYTIHEKQKRLSCVNEQNKILILSDHG